ncbi:MAG: GIY-YIG nuclease family protein [Mojavia pulchra JT2-VF2]|jgi:hypothetical protein|uniref:GIY-YIG nuclease family protein n=1 Tax=Mojavia pulchra JT2-VF2 TaxID=287848 RepID=A0A951UJX1_9NOST|nr:GIY-YIG nuclease family protein [Mojavia pulchra JT2-VF2]
MTLINPFNLPSVYLSETKNLPNCTAIYFAIDSQNRILYVGQATNLASRWKNHHRQYQLEEIDKNYPVRIAWQAWNESDLGEAEKYLINNFQPLLNGRKVELPAVIPSEVILRDFLKVFSRRLIIIGIKYKNNTELTNVYLKYDWTDCSPKGTAARIKSFIRENKDKNTSLKFKWHKYGRMRGIIFRPGSREQKVNARQNRSYNNHWQVACNGVILHITPSNNYKEFKSSTDSKELAGIKLRTLTKVALSEMSSKYPYEYSGISCLESDPIPLLWVIGSSTR